MSEEDTKVLKQVRRDIEKAVPKEFAALVGKKVEKKIRQEDADEKRSYGQLSRMPDNIQAIKETPHDPTIRRRHVGNEAMSMIARRALVGLSWLRSSRETVIYDNAPVKTGEYNITPLTLLKNKDGLASLLVTELDQEVLHAAQLAVLKASATTVPITPALSTKSPGRKIRVHNQGLTTIYCTFDGEYDEDTQVTTGATTPSATAGVSILTGEVATIPFMMKANPRLIAPTAAGANEPANILVTR